MSPSSDIVGPSPVTSNGTETTEIEDDLGSEVGDEERVNGQPSVRDNEPVGKDIRVLTVFSL
jgi:hypothetical protein